MLGRLFCPLSQIQRAPKGKSVPIFLTEGQCDDSNASLLIPRTDLADLADPEGSPVLALFRVGLSTSSVLVPSRGTAF